jgi:CRP-like cAMP-binding protein
MKPAAAKTPSGDIQDFLKKVPIFNGVAPALITGIQGICHLRRVKKGETLFMHGDAATQYYIVFSGWIKVFRETLDGKESIAGLFTRYDTFGEAAFFKGSNYPFGAEALEDSEVLCVDGAALREQIKQHGELAFSLLESVTKHRYALEMHLEHMALMSAPQRIGCFLLRLCGDAASDKATLTLPVDKALLASYLGMKAETFSRALTQLKENSVESQGATVTIGSLKKLMDFCCVSCSDDGQCRKSGD